MGESKICAGCGAVYESGTAVCPKCGAALPSENAEQSGLNPQEPQYVSVKEMAYPKARLWPRFVASFIDGVIGFCAAIPGVIIAAAGAVMESEGICILGVIIGAIGTIIYAVIKDGLAGGQSYGKRWNGLMVVQLESNEPCTKMKSLLRYLPFIIPYVGFVEAVMVLATGNGQRIGDKLAKTQVISVDIYNGNK